MPQRSDHTDHLGSVSAIRQGNGTVQQTRYLPFGGYRAGSGPNKLTDHAYTSQRENMEIGLYYYNARYYAPTLARFLSPDTLIPDPANPQAFNRYSYVENRPLNFNDPTGHSCVDALEGYPAEEYDCLAEGTPPLVFYLNGLGGEENYPRIEDANNEYIVLLYVLSLMAGEENVVHIPLFTEPYRQGVSHLDMIGESLGIGADQTQFAVDQISQYLAENPLQPGQRLVLVGSSAGGTVAIEALDLLEERGIFVDQVILRGSPVQELSLGNVGRVDYIAADPPMSDWYYSVDINPFDSVTVNEHSIPGFSGHQPQTARQLRQIAGMVVDLIIDAAIAR
ncbi:MAG: RHS repeat-associated core domain-containing protein [Bacteroidetes bacterium]|nr:MAG: RHS repeat-associated core domain-containing protein [Bacteroidota bacterium]